MLHTWRQGIWRVVCGLILCGGPSLGFCEEKPSEKPAETKATPEKNAQKKAEKDDEYFELMRVFTDTFEEIDRSYVKDIDRRSLIEAAVHGMLAKLDPYSDYISPEELNKFNETVEQEYSGVGIQIDVDPEKRELIVLSPLPGSPAYEAKILAGDRIVEIEGKKVKDFERGKELESAISLLKGEAGVKVSLGLRRSGGETVEPLSLTRAVIQLDSVLGDIRFPDGKWQFMLDDQKKIGYLRISHFTHRTEEELKAALKKLKETGLEGLILDLRFNPGGFLDTAVAVSDLFIETGTIVSTSGRNSREKVFAARKIGTFTGFPIAILVNRFSASASEIVSACMQDHHRAIIVGERSFGKGSVQTLLPVEEGKSALKLTTASYHRPSGKNIHRFPDAKETDEWGVLPDPGYEVKLTLDDLRHYLAYRQDRDKNGKKQNGYVDPVLAKGLEALAAQGKAK